MDPYNMGAYVQLVPYGVEIPNRVFVGAIPFSMTELELKEFFCQFGNVKDSKIITDRKGVSKGYGFVTFDTEEEAIAIYSKGSFYFQGKKLNVARAVRKQGGQYTKANQEYMNGQRLIYMHPSGYLMSQQEGGWVFEQPNPHSEPAKPFYNPYVVAQLPPYLQTTVAPPSALPGPPTPISQPEVYSTIAGYYPSAQTYTTFTTQATPTLPQPLQQEPLIVETDSLHLSDSSHTTGSNETTGSGDMTSNGSSCHLLEEVVSAVSGDTLPPTPVVCGVTSDTEPTAPKESEVACVENGGTTSDLASLVQQTKELSIDTKTQEGNDGQTSNDGHAPKTVVLSHAPKSNGFAHRNGFDHSKPPRYQLFRPPLLNGFSPHAGGGSPPLLNGFSPHARGGSHHLQLSPLYHGASSYPLLSGPPPFHGPITYNPNAPPPPPQTIRPPRPYSYHYPGPATSMTFTPTISPVLGAM